jgi:hypothetical protein
MANSMKTANWLHISALFIALPISGLTAAAQSSDSHQQQKNGPPVLVLGESTVCEDVRNGEPAQPAVAFSVTLKRVYCFSDFISVLKTSVTYHNWFYRDSLKASVKLTVRPPRWSTYSSVQLRDSEKGPWRIEITDEEGDILGTLRFSVID